MTWQAWRVRVALLLVVACGSSQRAPLGAVGGDNDEGAGVLARASLRLNTNDQREEPAFDDSDDRRINYGYGYEYGGDPYGGDPYGGDPYGGSSYANWRMPQWNYSTPNRTPRYQINVGMTGALEGTVSWNGQMPAQLKTACGPIENPTLRVSSDKHLRGVIVYIEKVTVGRSTPYYARPVTIGGTLAKTACALVPAAQIVAPVPGSITVHGDGSRTKVRIAPPTGAAKTHELQEGGLVAAEVKPGITKIDTEDGKLAASWVIGLETPYYAITDDAGRYRIDELAAGTYEVTFWQAPVASIGRDGTFTYGQPIIVKRSVTIGSKTASLSVTLGR